MTRVITSIIFMIAVTAINAQQMQLEVIPLKNSTPDQIIEVIRPLVAPGGSISGMNNQLIIKTTPANLAEIKQLLLNIDTPVRRLLITVSQGKSINRNIQSQTISGQGTSGDVSISNRRASDRDQGLVISSTDTDGNRISYQLNNEQELTDNENVFSVQTLDGQPAYIQSGLSVPVQNQSTVFTRNGVIVQDTVEYVDATSGFYVLPRTNGTRVTVMVAPNLASVSGRVTPTFVVQNVQTTVTGTLGEWIEIGGLDQTTRGNNRGILSGRANQETDSRSILIKVEEIR